MADITTVLTMGLRTNIQNKCAGAFLAASTALGGVLMNGGCASQGDRYDFQGTPQIVRAKEETFIIVFASNTLLDLPWALPNPVHNSVWFLGNHDLSKPLYTLNGTGVSRTNAQPVALGNDNNGLFAIRDLQFFSFGRTMVTEVWRGTETEMLQKLIIALDAAKFINDQNLRYRLFDGEEKAQNCNSVAYTLMKAMELKIPERHASLLAPGSGRLLLPENWKSIHTAKDALGSDDPKFLKWYVDEVFAEHASRCKLNACILPDPARAFFFDPAQPFVQYEPLFIENAFKRWELLRDETKINLLGPKLPLPTRPRGGVPAGPELPRLP